MICCARLQLFQTGLFVGRRADLLFARVYYLYNILRVVARHNVHTCSDFISVPHRVCNYEICESWYETVCL